jgi:hypothetical protein
VNNTLLSLVVKSPESVLKTIDGSIDIVQNFLDNFENDYWGEFVGQKVSYKKNLFITRTVTLKNVEEAMNFFKDHVHDMHFLVDDHTYYSYVSRVSSAKSTMKTLNKFKKAISDCHFVMVSVEEWNEITGPYTYKMYEKYRPSID